MRRRPTIATHLSVFFALIFSGCPQLNAADLSDSEKVIAAFIINFTLQTQWPKAKIPPVNICMPTPSTTVFMQEILAQRKPQNNNLPLHINTTKYPYDNCDVIYSPSNPREDKSGSQRLYITANNAGIQAHTSINLLDHNGSIHFEVNPNELAHVGLKISTKVLRLARHN